MNPNGGSGFEIDPLMVLSDLKPTKFSDVKWCMKIGTYSRAYNNKYLYICMCSQTSVDWLKENCVLYLIIYVLLTSVLLSARNQARDGVVYTVVDIDKQKPLGVAMTYSPFESFSYAASPPVPFGSRERNQRNKETGIFDPSNTRKTPDPLRRAGIWIPELYAQFDVDPVGMHLCPLDRACRSRCAHGRMYLPDPSCVENPRIPFVLNRHKISLPAFIKLLCCD